MAKRIKAFDIFRGSMIFYCVILHALIQRVFMCDGAYFALVMEDIPIWGIVVLFPLIYISLWGSIFIFLSGASVAYTMATKAKKDPTEMGNLLKGRIISSFLLYVVYYIQKIFFNAQTSVNPYPTHSFLTGALETGNLQFPELIHILTSDTLEMLALVGITLSILFYFMWRKNGFNARKTTRVLLIAGIVMMFSTLFIREIIGDPASIKLSMVDRRRFGSYYFFLRLYAERFAIFPVYAFSLFGAVFGIKLANGENFRNIARYGFITGALLNSVFLFQLLSGFDLVNSFASEMVPIPLQFNVIGSQIITLTILLRIFDFNKKPFPKHRATTHKLLQKYSDVSLTIYILEPTISISVYLLFEKIYGGPIFLNIYMIVLFIGTCVAIWYFIVVNWVKIKNAGSFEWLIYMGKKSIQKFFDVRMNAKSANLRKQIVENA